MKGINEALIRMMLEKKSIKYIFDSHQYQFNYEGSPDFSGLKVVMFALEEGVQFDFHYPYVDKSKSLETTQFLTLTNGIIPYGNFKQSDDGKIVYQMAIRIDEDATLTKNTIAMRVALLKGAALLGVCSKCIMAFVYGKANDTEQLLEELKGALPTWAAELDEIPAESHSSNDPEINFDEEASEVSGDHLPGECNVLILIEEIYPD